ncbi:SDR family oxidoreductase [Chelativorans sp. Marseille-P2723]|uniref:SDR family oxidoreductase n=1 Tax=Chelativorans sp. Marseille-P2723 TaxID=2709133 RepID=UPI00156F9827|nr:SDR family oxidoreductase [Chelativorans sp. Marseille-P2723]
MDLGLEGRTALVLGASGGLGGAIAHALAAEGVQVACAGRNEAKTEATAEAIRAAGGKAMAVTWDLADIEVIPWVLTQVEGTFAPVDILINNTGGPPPTTGSGQEPDLWRQQFEAMVLSVIALTDAVLPGMRERKWGRVITSTSSGVISPIPNLGLSNALRSTLVGWSKTISREIAKDGVTANIVVPGRIATARLSFLNEQQAKREGRSVKEVEAAATAAIPSGRTGTPEEYANVVAFLASARASYITGSIVRVDGGLLQSI